MTILQSHLIVVGEGGRKSTEIVKPKKGTTSSCIAKVQGRPTSARLVPVATCTDATVCARPGHSTDRSQLTFLCAWVVFSARTTLRCPVLLCDRRHPCFFLSAWYFSRPLQMASRCSNASDNLQASQKSSTTLLITLCKG